MQDPWPRPGRRYLPSYLHGGGRSSGDRKQLRRQAAHLAKLEIFGLAIAYRLAPAKRYPLAVYDAEAAVRYLRLNAEKYKIDPKRIFAIGSFAGGHLAALLETMNGDVKLGGDDCCAGASSDVTAVIAFHPELDLGDLDGKGANSVKFLGAACAENLPLCRTQTLEVPSPFFAAEGGPHTFWWAKK